MPLPPLPSASGGGRTLLGGVGYTGLRDGSAGPLLVARLAGRLGPEVDVEDLSYSPIDVLFLLQRRDPYARLVLVGTVARGDAPGTVRVAAWDPPEESAEALQDRIAEALSGVISLDNLLRIVGHFRALPAQVTVIEIEPLDDTWGEEISAPVARAMDEVASLLGAAPQAARA